MADKRIIGQESSFRGAGKGIPFGLVEAGKALRDPYDEAAFACLFAGSARCHARLDTAALVQCKMGGWRMFGAASLSLAVDGI